MDQPTPPAATESLLMRMQQHQTRLPPALAKVGAWALAYPFRTATLKIGELAAAAEVSVASVNRYATALGYEGYPEFRDDLLRAFESTFAPVEKLRAAVSRDTSNAEIMRESLACDAANIARTLDLLQPEQCEEAIRLIRSAKRVYTCGMGDSAYMATFLADMLDPYVDSASATVEFAGPERSIRRLMKVQPGDLMIAITTPRYSRRTVEHVQHCREQGARTLALTNSPLPRRAAGRRDPAGRGRSWGFAQLDHRHDGVDHGAGRGARPQRQQHGGPRRRHGRAHFALSARRPQTGPGGAMSRPQPSAAHLAAATTSLRFNQG